MRRWLSTFKGDGGRRTAVSARLSWRPILSTLLSFAFISLLLLPLGLEASRLSGERGRYLFYPPDWLTLSLRGRVDGDQGGEARQSSLPSVGGGSIGLLPLDIKLYRVRAGDTLTGIAERFGMDLDTIASLNREWGSGVHLIQVGEELKIPNQDGIFLPVNGSLEEICSRHSIPAEVVLEVNRMSSQELKPNLELFFPGVQHQGMERSVITGSAFLRPCGGFLTSSFGYRRDPFSGDMRFHRGIDIAAPLGSPVYASLDGKVTFIGNDYVLGAHVVIRHQVGYTSVYGHLYRIFIRQGQIVKRGQQIGLVGSTGRSTGSHLHFELRKDSQPLNALGLMSKIR